MPKYVVWTMLPFYKGTLALLKIGAVFIIYTWTLKLILPLLIIGKKRAIRVNYVVGIEHLKKK